MNAVDEFVIHNIQRYPALFPHRTAVLHHFLCVLGNGAEWDENGNVVSTSEKAPIWNYEEAVKKIIPEYMRETLGEEIYEKIKKSRIENLDKYQIIVNRAHELAHVRKKINDPDFYDEKYVTESMYPQTENALLMNIPENVSPEWLEACEEMKVEAIENGWKF